MKDKVCTKNILIFHGSFSGPDEAWLDWLELSLKEQSMNVIFPKLKTESWDDVTEGGKDYVCKKQNLDKWLDCWKDLNIDKDVEYSVVGHSTGPVFSLHVIKELKLKVKKAIWVSPFYERLNKAWQTDLVNESFVSADLDDQFLNAHIDEAYVIYSDNDPYVDRCYSENFANRFNAEKILVKDGKHFDKSTGRKDFPLVRDLILS
jgi:predicted alpha/beta hydrolase family esterase